LNPQILELADDLGAEWVLALWELVPTPEKAARARETTLARLPKKHRVRRFDAAHVLSELRKPALTVAQGTIEAATASGWQSSSCASSIGRSSMQSARSTGCAKSSPRPWFLRLL
jgi:hypothetical protein